MAHQCGKRLGRSTSSGFGGASARSELGRAGSSRGGSWEGEQPSKEYKHAFHGSKRHPDSRNLQQHNS